MTIGIEGSDGNLKLDGLMKMGAELQLLLFSEGTAFCLLLKELKMLVQNLLAFV